MGLPLHLIPDVRKMYGRDSLGTDFIDFDKGELEQKKKEKKDRLSAWILSSSNLIKMAHILDRLFFLF